LAAFKGPAANAALRAGVHHLVRLAAVELGPLGVRVNAVAPGLTLTPRMRTYLNDEKLAEAAARYPLRRAAEPSDVAGGVLFLASRLGSYVTGQVLVVDGGLSVQSPSPV
jgi:NAD(P)-dependent dehydrogenase (short-subunit alcohol dehydrogenase family)